jgi:hypothetical protein
MVKRMNFRPAMPWSTANCVLLVLQGELIVRDAWRDELKAVARDDWRHKLGCLACNDWRSKRGFPA